MVTPLMKSYDPIICHNVSDVKKKICHGIPLYEVNVGVPKM